MKFLLPILCAFIALTPLRAEAHNWNFCFNWKMQQEDGNVGEDHHQTTSSMKARGVAFAIMHDNWLLPHMSHASESNGCFAFTANETGDFEVTVWAESSIGDGITIRAFEDDLDKDPMDLHGGTRTWVFFPDPNTNGGTVNITPSTFDPVQNLIAWGTFIVYWIDHLSGTRIDGPTNLNLINEGTGIGGSFQGGVDVNISPETPIDPDLDPNDNNKVDGSKLKFLIGHEVGHWLLHEAWGLSPDPFHDYSFSIPNLVAICDYEASDFSDHALFSQEWNASAFHEGFPHFLSTLAFNDHNQTTGFFRYYKYVPAYETLLTEGIVDVENSGAAGGWAHASCKVNGLLADGTGTQIDWLRHYWDFRTNAATSPEFKPSHAQLFQALLHANAVFPWDGDEVYDHLTVGLATVDLDLTTTQQAALVDRWEAHAAWNGVAQ